VPYLDKVDQAVVIGTCLSQLVGLVHLLLQLGHLGLDGGLLGLHCADLLQHLGQLGSGVGLQETTATTLAGHVGNAGDGVALQGRSMHGSGQCAATQHAEAAGI
jgi:hypothetical protein